MRLNEETTLAKAALEYFTANRAFAAVCQMPGNEY
jgi:hypothetical protein